MTRERIWKTIGLCLLLAGLGEVSTADAHEFWISPRAYAIPAGDTIQADLRTGDEFTGNPFPYFPPAFERFQMILGDDVTDIAGRMGDLPAVNMTARTEGLAVLVQTSTPDITIYKEWEKFEDFVRRKAGPSLLQAHRDRGLPTKGFVETYRRFAKSLVAVGHGRGRDRELGLETEITALGNPYTMGLPGVLKIRVTYQGTPRRNAKIEIFRREPDGAVSIDTARTDSHGVAEVPLLPGTEYLVDAVVIRPVDIEPDEPGERTPVWESLWASLTFRTPPRP